MGLDSFLKNHPAVAQLIERVVGRDDGPGLTLGSSGPSGSGLVLGASDGGTGAGLSAPAASGSGYALMGDGSPSGVDLKRAGMALQLMGQHPQRQQVALQQDQAEFASPDLAEQYAVSSKKLKRPVYGYSSERMKQPAASMSGIRPDHPIDRNGLQIASIQALTKRIAQAKQRLAQLEKHS